MMVSKKVEENVLYNYVKSRKIVTRKEVSKKFGISVDTVFNRLLSNGILIRNVADNRLLKNCLRVTVGKPSENNAFLRVIEKLS